MALTRQQKEEVVQEMQGKVQDATSVVFVAFDGVSLGDMTELRDKLFAGGCNMQVIPKRLLKLALSEAKLAFDPSEHEGQIAVIWGGDAVAPAQIIHGFVKGHKEEMRMLSGTLEGEDISQDQVTALAQLPSREQLLAQLVSVLAGPMRGLAGVLAGVPRSAVYVLQAIRDQKEA